MKKIILGLALACLCVLTLASCESKNNGKIIIRVLENDTAKKEGYLDYLLEAFNEKYADQNVEAVDANMDEYCNLENDGPYGYGPDVLYQANDVLMKYVEGKHILPIEITKLECYSQIPENAWDAYKATVDGRDVVCGVPVNVQQPLLYYRKDMLPENWKTEYDKNNNDIPDMVEFWTEMYSYSKSIRESDSTKFGFALNLTDAYFNSGFLFSNGAYIFGDNNTNDQDVGMNKANSKLGAKMVWDLAGLMDLKCVDDSFTNSRCSMLANGTIFANICTPDITSQFIKELALEYKKTGLSDSEALAKANENLVITGLPKLPKSKDITQTVDVTDASLWEEQKVMGGINGYGISSYTKNREWSLKFVEFATSKEMVSKRAELLGIVAARADISSNSLNSSTKITFDNLNNGNLVVMPSISSVRAIWTPISSCLKIIATDGCGAKKMTLSQLQVELDKLNQNIIDSINTLK